MIVIVPPPRSTSGEMPETISLPVFKRFHEPTDLHVKYKTQGIASTYYDPLNDYLHLYSLGFGTPDCPNMDSWPICYGQSAEYISRSVSSFQVIEQWIGANTTRNVLIQFTHGSYKFLFLDGPSKREAFAAWMRACHERHNVKLEEISAEMVEAVKKWTADNLSSRVTFKDYQRGLGIWIEDPTETLLFSMRWQGAEERSPS